MGKQVLLGPKPARSLRTYPLSTIGGFRQLEVPGSERRPQPVISLVWGGKLASGCIVTWIGQQTKGDQIDGRMVILDE